MHANANKEKVTTPVVVREVARRMGCYRKDARELLDHFASVVAEQVAAGKRVQYAGLGIFYPAVSKRGRGAGKHVKVRFRPARSLAEKVMKGGLQQDEKPCTTG
ncbi:MAG: HU family DNA-binding protein [Thermoanaerobacter sp.]|nr:HU family DNA-binding protein [Thermoanaerobacter sp.]